MRLVIAVVLLVLAAAAPGRKPHSPAPQGAGYADVGLKAAIAQGIVPGPRMIVATRALVATGS